MFFIFNIFIISIVTKTKSDSIKIDTEIKNLKLKYQIKFRPNV